MLLFIFMILCLHPIIPMQKTASIFAVLSVNFGLRMLFYRW